MNKQQIPNYIFEISWEVCHKVGGIHTVITSKALTLQKQYEDHLIMIGPDLLKSDAENIEFTEDKTLFADWQMHAVQCGLKIKTGRWKIAGNPIVFLVDFRSFYENKNDLFGELWEQYHVNSISGGEDYIEPALFGHAAAKTIECFYHHHLNVNDKVIAQFHEWLTGTGVLYLHKNVSQVATVFTTHATVAGRLIAGSGLPLYSRFEEYNGDEIAYRFNCVAKHSLEKKAAFNADCFTSVSEITDRECMHFLRKKSDVITPNGFDKFMVSDELLFKEKRIIARKKLFSVAQSLLGCSLSEDSVLIIHSGRYEFHNKGIDVFIDALGELNHKDGLTKNAVAFIVVPASNTGPQKDLQQRLHENNCSPHAGNKILTHSLRNPESDAILHRFQYHHLDNAEDKKVKVIFVPEYMNGCDGVFNLQYYDLLIGFDLSVFPSYYEPFGYTPLESLMFHIPTVTTTLSGFGKMMQDKSKSIEQGIAVLERNDTNHHEITQNISSLIRDFANKNLEQISAMRAAAFLCSQSLLWKNYITYYQRAYSIALQKAGAREHIFDEKKIGRSSVSVKIKTFIEIE